MPGFIRGLFREILGREATEADVAYWLARKLANPKLDLPSIFLASDEYAEIRSRRATSRGVPDARR